MKKITLITLVVAAVVLTAATSFSLIEKTDSSSLRMEEISLPGATVLAFGPDNVLFIGDSKGAVVHAIKTEGQEVKDPIPFNLTDFDRVIAKELDIDTRDLIVNDMKIHPASQEAYLAIKKGHAADAPKMVSKVVWWREQRIMGNLLMILLMTS